MQETLFLQKNWGWKQRKEFKCLKLQNKHAEKVAEEQLEAAQELAKDLEDKFVEVKMKAGEGRTYLWFCFHKRDFCSS